MPRAFAVLIAAVLSTAAHADTYVPSNSVLAEMGLVGLQILTDDEAAAVRGRGFEPGNHLAGFADYEFSKLEFQERVAAFRDRIDTHTFRGAARFQAPQQSFQKRVQKFRNAVGRFQQKIH